MAHFAKLDENNVVLEVNVVNNAELVTSKTTTTGKYIQVTTIESEEKGIVFLTEWSNGHSNWKQTSYNGNFRGKYAAIGDIYDTEVDEFRTPVVAPSINVPVIQPIVEVMPQMVVETQAPIGLVSTGIPALTSADIQSITSQQISGLE